MKPSLIINVLLMLLGLAVGLLMAEGVLRFLKPPQVSQAQAPCIYVKDEAWGYRFIPNSSGVMRKNFEIDNHVKINAEGFHDIDHDQQEGRRILAVGDSFTAALEVDRTKGWTQVMQQSLREQGQADVDVINLGIDGTGTNIHLSVLETYVPQYQPELVVLAFYRNDADDVTDKRIFRECHKGYTISYQDEAHGQQLRAAIDAARAPGVMLTWLYDNVYFYRLLIYITGDDIYWQNGLRSPTKNWLLPSTLDLKTEKKSLEPIDINDMFTSLQTLASTHNFRLLIVPVPANDNWHSPTDSMDVMQESVASDIWPTLDIVNVLPNIEARLAAENKQYRDLFWQYDEHMNALGNRYFGLAIADAVSQYGGNSPIELQIEPVQSGLWTAVQWQDSAGDWHDVENWRGTLDTGGKIRWWVAEKDFGTGPFRWAISASEGEAILATTDLFHLPSDNESLRLTINLK